MYKTKHGHIKTSIPALTLQKNKYRNFTVGVKFTLSHYADWGRNHCHGSKHNYKTVLL